MDGDDSAILTFEISRLLSGFGSHYKSGQQRPYMSLFQHHQGSGFCDNNSFDRNVVVEHNELW